MSKLSAYRTKFLHTLARRRILVLVSALIVLFLWAGWFCFSMLRDPPLDNARLTDRTDQLNSTLLDQLQNRLRERKKMAELTETFGDPFQPQP